ncbi:phage major tail tube protein [Kiloniella laminariae]|uniref:Phage major tail tube protein n=1 Tax=Kiloniella laminariae TaxID=454162 RepID=A0ABT4LKQ9_9PROT|nr:phage major tail tube protein [Kiloniella laminariae]MCZ4281695.1 phage major tail tube protein [Kiloniella laminariae]
MIPSTLKNFNIFINGTSYVGEAEEITPPKLTRITEDYRAGGMHGPVELDLGQDKLEMEVTFKGWNKELLKHYGAFAADAVPLRFRGAARSEAGDVATDAIEISVRGRLKELDFGSAKTGEANSLKVMIPLTAFKYEVNGYEIIDIDQINMIFRVNGVDLLAEERQALGI